MRTVLSGAGDGNGDDFNGTYAIAIEPDGNFLVTDSNFGIVFRVDATSGTRTSFAAHSDGLGFDFAPNGITVEADGTIVVAEWLTKLGVVRIDSTTAVRADLSVTGDGNGADIFAPHGLAVILNAAASNSSPVAATTTAANVVQADAAETTYSFMVEYTDDTSLDVSTIDTSDVTVTGPAGAVTITAAAVDVGTDGTPRVATYTFTPPGGSWDDGDNGTYTIAMIASQVADGEAATVDANASLGTFTVSMDTTAPTVSSIVRADTSPTNASSVDFTVTFDGNVSNVDTTDFAITVTDSAAGTVDSVSSATGTTITVTVTPVSGDGTVRLDLNSSGTGITDDAANAIATGCTSGETYTVDLVDPTVSTLSPADDATAIAVDANLVLTFDSDVDAETGDITIHKTSDDSTAATITVTDGQITGSGSTTITINPTSDLDTGTQYYVLVPATGFDDSVGNSYAGISSTTAWSFTTTNDVDGTLTASATVTEPVGLPSTATATGSAVDVFDFTLTDGGSADGLSLDVSQVVLSTSGTGPFSQVTFRLDGADATDVTGTYDSGANTLTFSALSISVADGGAETYTVNAYYSDNTSLIEDQTSSSASMATRTLRYPARVPRCRAPTRPCPTVREAPLTWMRHRSS